MDIAEIVDTKLQEIMGREFFDAGFMLQLRDDEIVELYRRYEALLRFLDELITEFHFQTDAVKDELSRRLDEREVHGVQVKYTQRRAIKDYEEVVRRMKRLGYDENVLYERKELGIGKLEKLIPKEQRDEVLDEDTVEVTLGTGKITLDE